MSETSDRPTLGYIGLGLMAPMALRLCRAGYDVRAQPKPGQARPHLAEGATAMDPAGDVAAAADMCRPA